MPKLQCANFLLIKQPPTLILILSNNRTLNMENTSTVPAMAGETNSQNTREMVSESMPSPAHSQKGLELITARDDDEDDDGDSAVGDDVASSTASISSSILEYRKFQGRTFHSEKYDVEYFTPNDEQQMESVDIS
jgi:hypothetical protein